MVCVGIYAVLVASVAVAGNLHSALWSVGAYTVVEQNYNMIDNVLNNEKGKCDTEYSTGRMSIKEKLVEKIAVIEKKEGEKQRKIEKQTEKTGSEKTER